MPPQGFTRDPSICFLGLDFRLDLDELRAFGDLLLGGAAEGNTNYDADKNR